ncbi:MAG: hypothetical protein PHW75_00070 [Patescibacteria group bacterium]|nr:hypothetical protein [Patescibacteria group bacterium]
MGKPIVLVVNNGLDGWSRFHEELGDLVDLRVAGHDDMYKEFARAQKDGGPAIVGIGCITNGPKLRAFCNTYVAFIRKIRQGAPDGPGYIGPIMGLCDNMGTCVQNHLAAGCDEVHGLEPNGLFGTKSAGERILEILGLSQETS